MEGIRQAAVFFAPRLAPRLPPRLPLLPRFFPFFPFLPFLALSTLPLPGFPLSGEAWANCGAAPPKSRLRASTELSTHRNMLHLVIEGEEDSSCPRGRSSY